MIFCYFLGFYYFLGFLLFFRHLTNALICIFDMHPKSANAVMRLKQLSFINSFHS